MAFRKTRVIYKSERTKVYINQCHNKGKKTKLFTVRRDDKTGLADLIGVIKFDGAWRQYIFFPEMDTKWSSSCKRAICDFEDELNKEIRAKWRKKSPVSLNSQNGGKSHEKNA